MYGAVDFLLNIWPLILLKKIYVIIIYFDVIWFTIDNIWSISYTFV